MASITSVISLFVLLLATYSYSLPVGQLFENSTAEFEWTTGDTIVDEASTVVMQLISDDESTGVPLIQTPRSYDDSSSDEATTADGVTLSPRSSKNPPSSYEPDVKRSLGDRTEFAGGKYLRPRPITEPKSHRFDERSLDDFLFTTMESSTEFDRRAFVPPQQPSPTRLAGNRLTEMKPDESLEEVESSTPDVSVMDVTTDVEPSSSFNSFGKFTGLLQEDHTEETFTTPEYETTEPTSEESTTKFPVKTQRLTKTIAYIPGRITETKIYSNAPSRTSVVVQRFGQKQQQQQLSQGQKQPVFEKEESNN